MAPNLPQDLLLPIDREAYTRNVTSVRFRMLFLSSILATKFTRFLAAVSKRSIYGCFSALLRNVTSSIEILKFKISNFPPDQILVYMAFHFTIFLARKVLLCLLAHWHKTQRVFHMSRTVDGSISSLIGSLREKTVSRINNFSI